MSPARHHALIAAMARFARACRLQGAYDGFSPAYRHEITERLALNMVLGMTRARNSRQITNALNAAANVGM